MNHKIVFIVLCNRSLNLIFKLMHKHGKKKDEILRNLYIYFPIFIFL